MPTTEKLTIVINSDSQKASAQLKALAAGLDKVDSSAADANKEVKGLGDGMKKAAAGALVLAGGFTALLAKGLKNAAALEQTAVSLEVLTGSADQARKTLAELEKFAEITPFKTDEVLAAGKALIAFGESTDTVSLTLERLGNVASITNQRSLQEMVVMFSKIRQAGTLYAEDLNQLLEAGVDVFGELTKITGKNTGELKKMASQGLLTADMIEQVFINLNKEVCKAFNMMAKQSQTLTGLWSTTVSIFDKMASNMGEALLPIAKDVLRVFIDNKDAIVSLGSVVGGALASAFKVLGAIASEVIGWFKTGVEIWRETAGWVKMLAGAIILISSATKIWAVAQAALNAIMAVNPIFLIIGAIAALIVGIIKLRQNWDIVAAAFDVGLEKIKDAFFIATAAIKFVFLKLLSGILWIAGKMFRPFIDGINKLISVYNKFAGKAIAPLKNVAAAGSYYANQLAEAEKKKLESMTDGSVEYAEKKMALDAAILANKQKNDKSEVDSDKKKNKTLVDSTTKTTKKVAAANKKAAKAVKTEWEKSVESVKTAFGEFSSVVSTSLNILNDITGMIFDNMENAINEFYDARVQAEEEALQSLLAAHGLAEQTTLQRLQSELAALKAKLAEETDETKRAELERQILAKETEIKREEFTATSAAVIEGIEAEKSAEIRRLNHDRAVAEKVTAIASAAITGASAVISALALGPIAGPIAAAVIGGLVAVQIGIISGTPIPEAENGALIKGSATGTLIRAGEKNKSELVVPFENKRVMDKLGGGSGGGGWTINIENLYGADDLPDKVAEGIDKALYKLKQDGNSRFAE